jgi:ABC-type enterochelin transport system substrate-binding protein
MGQLLHDEFFQPDVAQVARDVFHGHVLNFDYFAHKRPRQM